VHKFRVKHGKLYVEIETVIVLPLELVPITTAAITREKLTLKEQQVFDGLLKGMGNKEIGASMNLTERTVKYHMSNLLRKFRVATRGEILALFGKR
jgi:DNA-binding NarL/FixJ family response regulator